MKFNIPLIKNLLVLILLAMGLVADVFLIQSESFFRLRAQNKIAIVVETTNITDTSAYITWMANEPTNGVVRWGLSPTQIDRIVVDTQPDSQFNHQIALKNLDPNTTYYFFISVNNNLYGNSNNPYSFTTGPKLSTFSTKQINTILGTIVDQNGIGVPKALIYIEADNMNLLSAVSDDGGGWVMSLRNARNESLDSYRILDGETQIKLWVNSQGNEKLFIKKINELKESNVLVI